MDDPSAVAERGLMGFAIHIQGTQVVGLARQRDHDGGRPSWVGTALAVRDPDVYKASAH